MASDLSPQRGYYSLLRWASDPTRDEAKNVAVLLVSNDGGFGGIRHASVGQVSPRLTEQGVMDALLVGLEEQFASEVKPTLQSLEGFREGLNRSLYLTEPQPTAVFSADETLFALYKAYVAPRAVGRRPTKGAVLDGVMANLRRQGLIVRRGAYVSDYLFDAIIDQAGDVPGVIDVLSYGTPTKDWSATERDAGHFLYALERIKARGLAVVRAPSEGSYDSAYESHERVSHWFDEAKVPVVAPADVVPAALSLLSLPR